MLNNAESGWIEFQQKEHTAEEYIEKFGLRLNREQIIDETKEIMMKEYLADIGSQIAL